MNKITIDISEQIYEIKKIIRKHADASKKIFLTWLYITTIIIVVYGFFAYKLIQQIEMKGEYDRANIMQDARGCDVIGGLPE